MAITLVSAMPITSNVWLNFANVAPKEPKLLASPSIFMKVHENSLQKCSKDVKLKNYIGPPKLNRKQKHSSFLSGFPDVRMFRCPHISQNLLDKTYIYAHHQIELNKGIKMMGFIC